MDTYKPVIGMEIHVELKTASKMFCGCKNDPFHAPKPNMYTCPVCLGMPGALPVPNRKAVEWTIMLGLALGCSINELSKFDRKNYFYPDLAKGYQISQYDQPLCINGKVSVDGGDVRIHRVHLEEDTGKLQHATVNGVKVSLVDFNRSGVPLVEIVTEPDVKDGEHAKAFLKKLHGIITDLGISDAEMDKGSMRLEPNISVRKPGETDLPKYKVEVKNINSFNFVKKAIEFEVVRHIEILQRNELPKQETRGWNEGKNQTFPQRSKEEAQDYRYFPEPDIPPMRFTKDFIEDLRSKLPQTGDEYLNQFINQGLSQQQASTLVNDQARRDLYAGTISLLQSQQNSSISAGTVANWVINKIDPSGTAPVDLIGKITQATTIQVMDSSVIEEAVAKVIEANPKAVADYKSGKETVIMFFLGQVLRELKGNADKAVVLDTLKKRLAR